MRLCRRTVRKAYGFPIVFSVQYFLRLSLRKGFLELVRAVRQALPHCAAAKPQPCGSRTSPIPKILLPS